MTTERRSLSLVDFGLRPSAGYIRARKILVSVMKIWSSTSVHHTASQVSSNPMVPFGCAVNQLVLDMGNSNNDDESPAPQVFFLLPIVYGATSRDACVTALTVLHRIEAIAGSGFRFSVVSGAASAA